jgi:hypothetical protein
LRIIESDRDRSIRTYPHADRTAAGDSRPIANSSAGRHIQPTAAAHSVVDGHLRPVTHADVYAIAYLYTHAHAYDWPVAHTHAYIYIIAYLYADADADDWPVAHANKYSYPDTSFTDTITDKYKYPAADADSVGDKYIYPNATTDRNPAAVVADGYPVADPLTPCQALRPRFARVCGGHSVR